MYLCLHGTQRSLITGDPKSAEILAISVFNTHMTAFRLITVIELSDYERSVMFLYDQQGVVIIIIAKRQIRKVCKISTGIT